MVELIIGFIVGALAGIVGYKKYEERKETK